MKLGFWKGQGRGLSLGLGSAPSQGGGAAPLFSSAEIGTVNESTVVVTFDQDITASNYATGVTIKVNGEAQPIASATRQGNHAVVYYVIPDGFFVNTDAVTWEYTGGNIVSESDATALATVTAQIVTNNEDVMKATFTLTNAQIKALPTVTVEVVAAPGANKIIQVMDVYLTSNIAAGGDYTNFSADINGDLEYTDGSAFIYLANDTVAGLSQVTDLLAPGGAVKVSQRLYPYPNSLDAGWGLIFAPQLNADFNKGISINFSNTAGDLTGGNAANTLTVTVVYIVIDAQP